MISARAETSTHVIIDGRGFLLDSDRDLVELMGQIESAARSGPAFVHLSAGTELVSVLVSARTQVVIQVERESVAQELDEPPFGPLTDWDA